jgi:hypothetical protein
MAKRQLDPALREHRRERAASFQCWPLTRGPRLRARRVLRCKLCLAAKANPLSSAAPRYSLRCPVTVLGPIYDNAPAAAVAVASESTEEPPNS